MSDDRECLGCREKFEGGVHAFMCGTCTFKLLNEGIIVKREDLQWLIEELNNEAIENRWTETPLFDKLIRIKEEYGIE